MKFYFALKNISNLKLKKKFKQILQKRNKLNDYNQKLNMLIQHFTKFYKLHSFKTIEYFNQAQDDNNLIKKELIKENTETINRAHLYKFLINDLRIR